MERENNIDRQSLASIAPDQGKTHFRIDDTHAAGRVRYAPGGGRPTREMLSSLADALPRWSREAITYCVIAEGGDPFSLGWDMAALLAGDRGEARACLAESYALAWQLDCFIKPTVPLIDGLISGAGVALTLYGTHRVAGAGYRLAISGPRDGWFPDHGLTQVLAQLPDQIGTYLALTGASLGPADAHHLGLVTQCIPAKAYPEIVSRLADADPVDPLLDGLHEVQEPSVLQPHVGTIARCFAADRVETILERLEAVTGDEAAWAHAARAAIVSAPRLATALTLRLLRENLHGDLREAIIRDFRIASRLLARPEVMAMQGAVTSQMLSDLLAALDGDDLRLATRAEMQAPVL